jgi:hypothetical protein
MLLVRRARKITTIAGLIFFIAVLFPVLHHFQLRFALEHYLASLKALGEPMEFSQVMPPSVPSEQNGAPFIAQALTNFNNRNLLNTNGLSPMRMIAPGKAMVGWRQKDIRSDSATNTWNDLEREIEKKTNWLNSFHSLGSHPVLDFNLDYQETLSLRLPHLPSLRQSTELLQAQAINNLRRGHPSESCANIQTMLALAKGLTEERIQWSQSVRMAIVRRGVEATWEVLQYPNIPDNDLAALQQNWQALDFVAPFENTQKMGRVRLIAELNLLRAHPQQIWKYVMAGSDVEKFAYQCRWRWFWSYADERRTLEIDQIFLKAIKIAEKDQSYVSAKNYIMSDFETLGLPPPSPEKFGFRMDIEAWEMRWLLSEDILDTFGRIRGCMTTETARNLAITAIALKRYELRFRHLPANLETLTPNFLKTVPIDWMDGKPLRYRLNSDGTFLLYSVGDNGKDDGGNPSIEKHDDDSEIGSSWQGFYNLDHVWPRPATDEEAQEYYANLAKVNLSKHQSASREHLTHEPSDTH